MRYIPPPTSGTDTSEFAWESGAEKSVKWAAMKTALSLSPPTADPGVSDVVWESSSDPTVSAGPVAPVNTVAPSNTGSDSYVGTQRSCNGGTWTGAPIPTVTYQWQRNDGESGAYQNIASATASTYTLVAGDDGYAVRCKVTATNTGGTTVAYSSATATVQTKTAPANTAVPTISGTVQVDQQITAVDGTWTGIPTPTLSHQWQISDDGSTGWADISGANSASYVPVAGDVGKYLRVAETGTNSEGDATAYSEASVAVAAAPSGYVMVSAAVVSSEAGHNVNDRVFASGNPGDTAAELNVDSVDESGYILTVSVVSGGNYATEVAPVNCYVPDYFLADPPGSAVYHCQVTGTYS